MLDFRRRVLILSALLLSSCGHEASGGATTPAPTSLESEESAAKVPNAARVLVGDAHRPVLFMGSDPDAAVFGFVVEDAEVEISGTAERGRVPVRIDGALRVKAFVPESVLSLRVQKRGRVRGTPVYVGPNDLVRPLGPPDGDGRVRVSVAPRIGGQTLGPYEGTYPLAGLSAQKAPSDSPMPQAGAAYVLPPGRKLSLSDEPRGATTAELAPQEVPVSLTVVAEEKGWLAVRVGEGPYLIGYTKDKLTPEIEPPEGVIPPRGDDGVPRLLRGEQGPLKRVAAETRVTFNEQVVAVFKREGWARVLAEFPEGQVDVFAAVDDGVTVRGLVPREALSEPTKTAVQTIGGPPKRRDAFEDETD